MRATSSRHLLSTDDSDVNVGALQPKPLLQLGRDSSAGSQLPGIARPAREPRRPAFAHGAAVVAVVGLVAGAGFNWWDRTTVHSGGPVSVEAGINGQRLAVGEPTFFGGMVLRNRAETPAVLENVRILGVTGRFEVLRLGANPVGVNGITGFPTSEHPGASLTEQHIVPAAKTRTASGAPNTGLQLVISARTTMPGVARIRGVEPRYRVGRLHYRRTEDAALYLCAPKEQFPGNDCPGEAENLFSDTAVDFPAGQ